MLVLYFAYGIRINRKRIIVVFAAGRVIMIFFARFVNVLANLIPGKYLRYMSRSSDNGIILLFHLIIFISILVIHIASSRNLERDNDDDIRIHVWAVIIEIVLLTMALRIDIFTRMAYFFMPSLPIFIDRASDKIEMLSNKTLLVVGLVIAIGLQFVIRLQINNIGGSLPYMFFF